jgi:phasin
MTQRKLEVPAELRNLAEETIDQAEKAFGLFFNAANKSIASVPNVGTEISKQALSFTEQNMKAAFDHARKLVHATDLEQAMQIQSEFLKSQFTNAGEHMRQITGGGTSAKKDSSTAKWLGGDRRNHTVELSSSNGRTSGPSRLMLDWRKLCDTSPVPKKRNRKLAKKKSVRREWTNADVRELKSLAKKKTGVARIAKALKRTVGATAAKAHMLGVSLDTRGWSERCVQLWLCPLNGLASIRSRGFNPDAVPRLATAIPFPEPPSVFFAAQPESAVPARVFVLDWFRSTHTTIIINDLAFWPNGNDIPTPSLSVF